MGLKSINNAKQICLADFGIAVKTSKINVKQKVGTKYYTAPEIENMVNYGIASDIFSYGVVLFELLTFEQDYQMARRSERLKLADFKSLNTLAFNCVNSNPDERPTADAIVSHLDTCTKTFRKPQPKLRNPVASIERGDLSGTLQFTKQ